MLYISKVSLIFFIFAFFYFPLSIFYKLEGDFYSTVYTSIFGFILSIVFAGLYQIVPNSQGIKLKYENLTFFNFFLFSFSFVFFIFKNITLASVVIFLSTSIFLTHILTVVKNLKPITIRFISIALFYIFISTFLFMISNFYSIPLKIVIHTFTVGVLLNLTLGVQMAWIPMLTMKVLNLKLAEKVFYMFQISIVLFFISFILENKLFYIISTSSFILSIFTYFYLLYSCIFKDLKFLKLQDIVKFFMLGWFLFIGGFLVGLHMIFSRDIKFVWIHLDFMVFGFAFLTILGGTLHLMPRIIWNMKYMEKVKKGKNVPQINQLINQNLLKIFLPVFILLFFNLIFFDFIGFSNLSFAVHLVIIFISLYLYKDILKFYLL